jgi:hypothetical protein
MFVHETNSPAFQQLSQEMRQKRVLHNKPHNTGRKGYRGKRKEWEEEEDAKLAAGGKLNPWDQFPGCSRPYLRARVGKKKKKNTSEGSKGITFSNLVVVGVADRVKTLATQGSHGSFSGLERMISSPQHLRLQSIEVGSEVGLVQLAGVKGLVKSSLECTGRSGTRGLMLMM